MRKRMHTRLLHWFTLSLLLVGLVYDSYRYPLRINSTATSPTYADTPPWLSVGKYVIIASLVGALVLALRASGRKIALYKAPYALLYLYLCVVPIFYGIMMHSPEIVEGGFFFMIPLMLHLTAGHRVDVSVCTRFFVAATVLAIVTDALQVTAFLVWARLPALAYNDSIMVRFGGYWDDPNGFGIFLAFLIPFAAEYWRGSIVGGLVILALGTCLVLTQSLTAIGAVFLAMTALGIIRLASRWRMRWSTLALGAALCLAGTLVLYWDWGVLGDLWIEYQGLRMASINAHLLPAGQEIWNLPAASLLGFWPLVPTTESGYVNMLGSCGLVYVLALMVAELCGVANYARRLAAGCEDRACTALCSGAICFLTAVFLAEFNLPVDRIFPINLFACLLLGLASGRVIAPAATFSARAPDAPAR